MAPLTRGDGVCEMEQDKRRFMDKILRYNTLVVGSGGCPVRNLFAYLWALDDQHQCCSGFRVPDTGAPRMRSSPRLRPSAFIARIQG